MKKSYTVGLDIGTNSVGWAVIDDEFNLAQGKKQIIDNGVKRSSRTNLWGSRLFDGGETAEERRLKRGMRRRISRRHERLNYLRGIFEPEIMKLDESFFIRMDESFLQSDDKKALEFKYRDKEGVLKTKEINNKEIFKCPIFKTEDKEKEYYKEFPTIYHLRNHLMNTTEKADLRCIYLALHHIVKYRGHFVNEGQVFDLKNIDIATSVEKALEAFNNATDFTFSFDSVDQEKANEILKDKNRSKSKKAFDLNELYKMDEDMVYLEGNEEYVEFFESKTPKQQEKFIADKQKQIKEFFVAVVGNKISPDKIFDKKEYGKKENEDFPQNLYFKNEGFDDQISELESFMTPEEIDVLIEGKKVYEAIVLSGILTKETLAASMVEKYDLHREQLEELKKFAKAISDEFYKKIFKAGGIYTEFVEGIGNPRKKLNRDDFYKKLKETFRTEFGSAKDKDFEWAENALNEEQKKYIHKIWNLMEYENYLPKQRMSDNGAIPYQVHEHELVKIIENQGKHYPFLMEKSGNEYKIQSLMTFRIPYYVGPLVQADKGEAGKKESDKSKFAWLQKKTDTKITPWNFEDVVDKEASSIEFIERMTSFCTYLPDEKVLPKYALLYQEFCVYNELITSGYFEKGRKKEYFSMIMMNDIVENLFKKKRKVSQDDVLDFLRNEKNIEAAELFGIDKHSVNGKPSFNNNMSTFLDLKGMGIDPKAIEDNRDLFDEIVRLQTIFTDKKSLKSRIEKLNEEWKVLTDAQIDKLSKKHYKGFGNLSKKLLDGIRDEKTGLTILETIKTGGYDNFMRLVSGETADRYSFKKQIESLQIKGQTGRLTYEVVEQLAGSPKIKKGIWQSLKIIKELEKYLGKENISRIVIEMSREDEGGRVKSRYKQLEKIYTKFEERNLEVFNELKGYEKNDSALKNERLHLYFRQNGKDAYTGEELKISSLSDYEVDHIIPQCFLKDDSIDNKVLVGKKSNQQKGGNVPSREIIGRMRTYWELWTKAGLISKKKLKHLTTGVLSDKVKEGFINRQLVENRQITKHVANILVKYFEDVDTVVLTPKAGLTTQFRKGIIYLPNPNYDATKAIESPQDYMKNRFIEEKLHDGFPKIRNLNDYHHAHDAYLNAIVALYLYREYPELKNAWVYGEYVRNEEGTFGKWVRARKDKSLQLISGMRNEVWEQKDPDTGEILEIDKNQLLEKIEKTLGYRNVNVVKKVERQIGKFGDESVYKKDAKAKNFASGLKDDLDANKYGGRKTPIMAFAVVVRCKNNKFKTLAIPAMVADEYLKATDKLTYLKELYPTEKIEEIKIKEIDKYTKFENDFEGNKITRLMASAQEAQKADSLVLSVNEARGLRNADEKILENIYDKITGYLVKNAVYNETHLNNWETVIREEFCALPKEEKKKFIEDAFSISKSGTTTAKGVMQGKIGGADGRQRHTSAKIDTIRETTAVINQSITGLFETRKTIE